MKKALFSSILLILSNSLLCQMIVPPVVHDPTTHAHLITTIEKANETVDNVKKQLKILEEAKEALSKVNNVIKQLQYIDQILEDQKKAIKTFDDCYKYIVKSDVFSPKEINIIIRKFTRALDKTEKTVSLATSIGSDGIFKMNDKERIEVLRNLSTEIREMNAEISELDRRYRQIADERVLVDFFK